MAGVYISWPFCSQKCTYCNFSSGVFPKELEAEYAAALLREIADQVWDESADTVYLGGGTPSLMPLETLGAILKAVPGKPWAEATLEAAPGTLTLERVQAWRAAGITRVSLGVQSFVEREAARTGRKHTAETVARDIAVLADSGIADFNIDLIAGLPGQTEATWEESVDWVERLGAPHASVYMLEVDEDSRLGQEVLLNGRRYGAPEIPSDEIIVRLYERAAERFELMGLRRYEISNFARPGFESRHNLKYWQLEPYFGFGADAHSCYRGRRWQNAETAAEYVALMRDGASARIGETAANPGEELFFVSLRLARGIADSPATSAQRRAVDRFISEGLLERREGLVRLTNRGILLSNEVFAELVA